ncbi:unnamed protein product [Trichobilharzia regenti]|nr:unnamed protein product [Trichobilharzia regenti]
MLRMREITRVIPTMLFARHAFRAAPTICKLSTSIQLSTASTSYLPPAPLPPPKEIVLNSLGEPTLASLGLNSYWPSGWYQSLLEALHVHLELPWWVAITTSKFTNQDFLYCFPLSCMLECYGTNATVIIRLCLFPLMVRQRRNLAKFTDAMPQFTILQERLTHARLSGNYIEGESCFCNGY